MIDAKTYRYRCAQCRRFDWTLHLCGGPGPTYAIIPAGPLGPREQFWADECEQLDLMEEDKDGTE